MNIIWLGHGSFRIEIEDQVILVDPWLNGNPMLSEDQHSAAIENATQILVTHGHFDHTADILQISRDTGAPVSGIFELANYLFAQGAVEGDAFNMGGTIALGEKVTASMVPASHSSTAEVDGTPRYMGSEAGFILRGEGRCIYISGDTSLMADMAWIGDYYKPDIGILSAGGHFTMDMEMAAYATRTYFNFNVVIPCHYRTFPLLEQSADALINGTTPGTSVIAPEVMEVVKL
ncbi:metal-dependent hydrolase [Sulfitobacter sp. F26169L]|uniref:metal-dependent hydrolase n=1 Tax=Sulfitobacter sp. F26169L TaxID=2996015 RepID=UPI002260DF10|nr:metal-dependent hydrolase [Sulfitobacter sp. F26169L]MCX7564782.1 metal-dependent hydrolase [Sulfitobacter sp. F26169L]